MKVGVIYLHVVGKSDPTAPPPCHYLHWSKRWIDSYTQFRGTRSHKLQVVHCGGLPLGEDVALFNGLDAWHSTYSGGGWDIGAHQYAALSMTFDFVICMATPTYFWRHGFIESMLEARNLFGDGIYGPTASYENKPHIRNCCWAFDPKTFAEYPHRIDTREKTFRAESGDLSITEWYANRGLPRIMVAVDGNYQQPDWRSPENIFRRGNQENCFIRDRHSDMYHEADQIKKSELAEWADGKRSPS